MDLSYILNRLGEEREHYYHAVVPPIFQTGNFAFDSVEDLRQAIFNERQSHIYTRGNNPTVEILRKKIAALAGADDSLIFSSGIAAISAAVMGNVKSGDHIVCVRKPYGWTNKLLNNYLVNYGVESTMIEGNSPANYEAAIRSNTKVFYLESPNSFTFELQDIEAIVTLAKKHGIITIIDNSYCTSLGQRCIEMGVDIEVHSASKYYGGHSDVVAGFLISSQEMINRIFSSELMNLGGIISPHDAWLLLRGLRTLPVRMEHIRKNTEQVVAFLQNHPLVEKINYPFTENFPQVHLAKKQMRWCGGLFSIQLRVDTMTQVELFCDNLKAFTLAVSWGGHESLVIPACTFITDGDTKNSPLPYNLVRFYVGLDEPEYLIEDLKQAFQKIE